MNTQMPQHRTMSRGLLVGCLLVLSGTFAHTAAVADEVTEEWVARYDGPANYSDRASAMAVDTVGNVYVTGYSTDYPSSYDYAAVKFSQPATTINTTTDMVISLNLDQGIESSLVTKLDAALRAIEDINGSNDVVACKALAAFINAVEAQSGKKIG